MRLTHVLITCAMCLRAASALAGSAPHPIESDRPDLAEGPRAVSPRSVQLEMGATRTFARGGEPNLVSVGEALLRAGVAPGWELRLGLPTWFRAGPAARGTTQGFGDATLGLKRDLPSPAEGVAVGTIVDVSLPLGGESFGGGEAGGGVALAVAMEVGPGAWCGNLRAGREGDATALLATLAFERPLTSSVAAFAEAAWIGVGNEDFAQSGVGLLWSVAPATQLDVRCGAEQGGAETHLSFGAGVVRRW